MRPRIREIDSLRGLAALAVVIYHYTRRYEELYGHSGGMWQLPYGYLGVDSFFLISGLVIFMTIRRVKGPLDFALRRIARLYPAYAVGVLLTSTVVLVAGLPGREVGIVATLGNLTMVQTLLGLPHVDGVYWSLQVELGFYSAIALLLLLGWKGRSLLPFLWWLILGGALQVGSKLVDYRAVEMANQLIGQYAPHFAIGAAIYTVVFDKNVRRGVLIAGGGLLYLAALQGLGNAVVIATLASVLYLSVTGRLAWLAQRPLLFLGSISYPLYLLHQNIGYVIIRLGYKWNLAPSLSILVALVVSGCLAWVLHQWVEKPGQQAILSLPAVFTSKARQTEMST